MRTVVQFPPTIEHDYLTGSAPAGAGNGQVLTATIAAAVGSTAPARIDWRTSTGLDQNSGLVPGPRPHLQSEARFMVRRTERIIKQCGSPLSIPKLLAWERACQMNLSGRGGDGFDVYRRGLAFHQPKEELITWSDRDGMTAGAVFNFDQDTTTIRILFLRVRDLGDDPRGRVAGLLTLLAWHGAELGARWLSYGSQPNLFLRGSGLMQCAARLDVGLRPFPAPATNRPFRSVRASGGPLQVAGSTRIWFDHCPSAATTDAITEPAMLCAITEGIDSTESPILWGVEGHRFG